MEMEAHVKKLESDKQANEPTKAAPLTQVDICNAVMLLKELLPLERAAHFFSDHGGLDVYPHHLPRRSASSEKHTASADGFPG